MSLIDLPRNELRDAIESARFPEDPRIIVVPDLRDFALFTEREAFAIHGMVTNYPETRENLRKLAHDYAKNNNHPDFSCGHNIKRFDVFNREHLNKKFSKPSKPIDPEFQKIMGDLLDAYRKATDYDGILDQEPDTYISTNVQIHCNVQRTMKWHVDSGLGCPTVSMAFNQSGPVCSTEPQGKGHRYTFGSGQALLIDDYIWHVTPTKDESWDDDPRVLGLI